MGSHFTYVSICLSLSICVSMSLSVSLCVSLCLSMCLSLSLYVCGADHSLGITSLVLQIISSFLSYPQGLSHEKCYLISGNQSNILLIYFYIFLLQIHFSDHSLSRMHGKALFFSLKKRPGLLRKPVKLKH